MPAPGSFRLRHAWLLLLGAVPAIFVAVQVAAHVRNIPFWDEYDAVLAFVVALDGGAGPGKLLELLFAVHNEHRMVVSRLIFAGYYWLTGGVNFTVFAIVGNAFLVAACGLLVASAEGWKARLRLGAVLGLVVFHLQHHESLFWAGSSIDHFFVVLGAVGSFVALARPGAGALALAIVAALLATFSLTHGLAVWLVGAAWLAQERRWRDLALWGGMATVVGAVFFSGFTVNPDHPLPTAGALPGAVVYWLTLVGGSATLGDRTVAPWAGAIVIAVLLAAGGRSRDRRERIALATSFFCVLALAMIAFGRLHVSGGHPIPSRYYILSALPLAMIAWIFGERALRRGIRRRWLVPACTVLVAFNVLANLRFLERGAVFSDDRASAVALYRATGSLDSAGPFKLYPRPPRAEALIEETRRRGIYRFPSLVNRVRLASPVETGDAVYFIDDLRVQEDSVFIRGWAFRPQRPPSRGDLVVVLRSPQRLIAFEAIPRRRPDVVSTYGREDVLYSGFELHLPRRVLPREVFSVGVAFAPRGHGAYTMTAHEVNNAAGAAAPDPTREARRGGSG